MVESAESEVKYVLMKPLNRYKSQVIRALISIHDVSPQTLRQVLRVISLLDDYGLTPVTLLVIPGVEWDSRSLAQLKVLELQGHVLAGHGWHHLSPPPRTIKHWLHSRFISRNTAEHLSLDERSISNLLIRCHRWFLSNNLTLPELYVPPAWGMGPITRISLRNAPFRYYEYLGGIYDSELDQYKRYPLVGFEADTRIREIALSLWNSINIWQSRKKNILRLSIHPNDLDLCLSKDLESLLSKLINCTI